MDGRRIDKSQNFNTIPLENAGARYLVSLSNIEGANDYLHWSLKKQNPTVGVAHQVFFTRICDGTIVNPTESCKRNVNAKSSHS